MKLLFLALVLALAPCVGFTQDDVVEIRPYDASDFATALKEWRPLAEQGDVYAQYYLGQMYQNGEGVPQDHEEAVNWYRKAAEQGHASAQFNLAVMYYNGNGVSQNYVYSYMWGSIAASRGNENAVKGRDLVVENMTAEDISKAEELARDCVRKEFKGCEPLEAEALKHQSGDANMATMPANSQDDWEVEEFGSWAAGMVGNVRLAVEVGTVYEFEDICAAWTVGDKSSLSFVTFLDGLTHIQASAAAWDFPGEYGTLKVQFSFVDLVLPGALFWDESVDHVSDANSGGVANFDILRMAAERESTPPVVTLSDSEGTQLLELPGDGMASAIARMQACAQVAYSEQN